MLNPEWQSYSLESLYHHFCQSPIQYLPTAINDLVLTLTVYNDLDLRWANVIKNAEHDRQVSEENSWGECLVDGIEAHYQEQNHENNISMFNRILAYSDLKSDESPIAYHWRGRGYHAAGQYDLAIADTTRAIELDPQNASYYQQRGVSYHEAGQYELAIADTTRAIDLDPQNASYYYSRG